MEEYILEKHRHGFLVKAPPGKSGIPVSALAEIAKMSPPNAVMSGGIAHALGGLTAIAAPDAVADWEQEIEEKIKHLAPEDRWWRGTDVGLSAATIFSVLAKSNHLGDAAWHYVKQAPQVPHDAADFGRCRRLVEQMPGWRARLDDVARTFPDSAWPSIVIQWDALCALPPEKVTETLRAMHSR